MEKAQQRPKTPLERRQAHAAEASRLAGEAAEKFPGERLTASLVLFSIVLIVLATNQHSVWLPAPDALMIAVRAAVPLAAALTVALVVWRPVEGIAAALALTPAMNAAQVILNIGGAQIIAQSVITAALLFGVAVHALTRPPAKPAIPEFDHAAAWERLGEDRFAGPQAISVKRGRRYRAHALVEVAAVGIVALAILSTLASRSPSVSANVLVHGILEPAILGALVAYLRPGARQLVLLLGALGFAAALGSVLNLVESLGQFGSVAAALSHRLYFAWYTYGNVGIYGIVMACSLPLEVALLVGRRRLALSNLPSAAVLAGLVLTMAGLFFTVSKSAWLSAAAATALLLIILVRSWWRRALVTVAVLAASALFIPWPSVFLQPVAPGANTAYATAITQIVGESRFDSWDVATLSGRGSVTERYYAVAAGIRMGLDHPLLGVGLDQYARYYVKGQYRPTAAKVTVDHAHSLFPEVAAELGLFAAVLLGVLVLAAMWSTLRVSRAARDRVTGVVAAAVMTGIAAWVIGATAYGCMIYRASLFQASDVVTFAVLAGMAVAVGRLHEHETRVGA